MLTLAQLRSIMPRLPEAKAIQYLPHLNAALADFRIDNASRTAAFIAQLAHESGEFRYMEEIWGPTDAQRRYEPLTPLAKRLGNTEPGDGLRFKGRGPIQITGRANYMRYGELLTRDLVGQPELAAKPDIAFAVAGLYWASNKLNEKADADDFIGITKRINGGVNGLEDRQRYHARARAILAEGFIENAVRRGAPTRSLPRDLEPLQRGFEAVLEV